MESLTKETKIIRIYVEFLHLKQMLNDIFDTLEIAFRLKSPYGKLEEFAIKNNMKELKEALENTEYYRELKDIKQAGLISYYEALDYYLKNLREELAEGNLREITLFIGRNYIKELLKKIIIGYCLITDEDEQPLIKSLDDENFEYIIENLNDIENMKFKTLAKKLVDIFVKCFEN